MNLSKSQLANASLLIPEGLEEGENEGQRRAESGETEDKGCLLVHLLWNSVKFTDMAKT